MSEFLLILFLFSKSILCDDACAINNK